MQSALEERALDSVLCEEQRLRIGVLGLPVATQQPQLLGTRSRQVAVARELGLGRQCIEGRQALDGARAKPTATARFKATTGEGQIWTSTS